MQNQTDNAVSSGVNPDRSSMGLPGSFSLSAGKTALQTYRLSSSLVLEGVSPAEVFPFFEDPRNLFTITPPWLDFRMLDPSRSEVAEGAEFDYTLRWLGMRIRWRSRIVHYHPPHGFTDVQLRGPYSRWEHRHSFEQEGGGTLMRDRVDYRVPLVAVPLHGILIRRQLEDIFRYRAGKVAEWVRGELRLRAE